MYGVCKCHSQGYRVWHADGQGARAARGANRHGGCAERWPTVRTWHWSRAILWFDWLLKERSWHVNHATSASHLNNEKPPELLSGTHTDGCMRDGQPGPEQFYQLFKTNNRRHLIITFHTLASWCIRGTMISSSIFYFSLILNSSPPHAPTVVKWWGHCLTSCWPGSNTGTKYRTVQVCCWDLGQRSSSTPTNQLSQLLKES